MQVAKDRLAQDAQLLDETVRAAGEIALAHLKTGAQSWNKEDGSPVSNADLAVDKFLHDTLLAARPDYGWLSEESVDDQQRLSSDYVFIVDPIDGTRAFLNNSDHWCVALCIIHQQRPIVASVFRPLTNEHFTAVLGQGAFCNGQKLSASSRDSLPRAKLVAHKKALQSPKWQKPFPDIDTSMTTSLVLRMCLVASGAFDGALAIGKKHEWDIAAGDLMVQEAGGRVTNFAGEDMRYNQAAPHQRGMVAAGSRLIDQLIEHTQSYQF